MPAPLVAPYGERATLGVSKEVTFGTYVAPTVFHAIEDFTDSPANQAIKRLGARGRRGQSLPIADGFVGKFSLTPEPDPDTVGQLMAFALGAQSAPALKSPSTTCYTSSLTLGQIPSFSTELNRVTDCIDYLGCKINGMSIGFDKGKGLTTKFDIVFATLATQASPATTTFSTKNPFAFTNPSNTLKFFGSAIGTAGTATVHSFSIDLKNNLVLDYFSAGSGSRSVVDFPQQQAIVTGKARLGFETDAAFKQFLGSSSATAPQASVPGVAFDWSLFTTDYADQTNNDYFGIEFILGNCFLETHSAPIKAGGIIYQDFSFTAAETANGANDDLKITLQNTANAAY